MITIAGRRVRFSKGRGKSQSVNICTVAGRAGEYDWVLVVDGPRIHSEADLAAFPGDSIEGLVTWVRQRYGATVRQYPAASTPSVPRGSGAPDPSPSASGSTAIREGIFAGVDAFIDRSFGLEDLGQAPHHKHKTSALRLSRSPPGGLEPASFLSGLYALVERNGRASTRAAPSQANWRLEKKRQMTSGNQSLEKRLEKAIAADMGNAWTNQMPTASGLVTPHERQRNIDLVHRVGPRAYEFIELKVCSDNPLFAMMEIFKNGLTYLYSRRHRDELGYNQVAQPPLWAEKVHLRVLAPPEYYRGYELGWLEGFLNRGLEALLDPALDGAFEMDVRFDKFPGTFDIAAQGDELAHGLRQVRKEWA